MGSYEIDLNQLRRLPVWHYMIATRLALILGDQLYPSHDILFKGNTTIGYMAEDYGLCTHYQYHKHKITFFLSAMRSHAASLRERHEIVYHQLTPETMDRDYLTKLTETLAEYPSVREIFTYEISDRFFREALVAFCEKQDLELVQVDNPGFLTPKAVFSDYVNSTKRPFMKTFYEQQRKRLNVLVDSGGNPLNGKWSFDDENRKKLPKKIDVPAMPVMTDTQDTSDVKTLVNELFADHPGDTSDFWMATTRAQALEQVDRFLHDRFELFGPYEDAFESDQVFLYHSVLSPYINAGLITAQEVVDKAIAYSQEYGIPFNSLEGFVRQIIGWREFVKGTYDHYEDKMRGNFFKHTRKLTHHWYDGTTGVAPLDDTILKARKYGYTHHIERLMIVGNIMLLCELDPEEVYRWFMEMYVDSADWVMVPNVFGMTQFAGGGVFATKPYICGANYWSKMSRYSKTADWAPTVNGLYWNFIDKHRSFFAKNHRMSMMVSMYEKKSPEAQSELVTAAQTFIDKVTK